jgi:hypothetical protein
MIHCSAVDLSRYAQSSSDSSEDDVSEDEGELKGGNKESWSDESDEESESEHWAQFREVSERDDDDNDDIDARIPSERYALSEDARAAGLRAVEDGDGEGDEGEEGDAGEHDALDPDRYLCRDCILVCETGESMYS